MGPNDIGHPLLPGALNAPTAPRASYQPLRTQPDPNPTVPRQYTTVGSVYNPNQQPLQPPVRRGRNLRGPTYPPRPDVAASLETLQYTPLQQNSDRAVSPSSSNFNPSLTLGEGLNLGSQSSLFNRARPITGAIDEGNQHTALKFVSRSANDPGHYPGASVIDYPVMSNDTLYQAWDKEDTPCPKPKPKPPVAVPDIFSRSERSSSKATIPTDIDTVDSGLYNQDIGGDPASPSSFASDSTIDPTNKKILGNMNMGSLTNIASYNNPLARDSTKIIRRTAKTVGHDTPVHPPLLPSQLSASQGAIEQAMRHPEDYPTLYSDTSHSSKGGPSKLHPEAAPWVQPAHKTTGVPAPLTAGPPGMRQGTRALTSAMKKSSEWGRSSGHARSSLYSDTDHMELAAVGAPSRLQGTGENIVEAQQTKIFDTLTPEAALEFYKDGLPLDFNYNTQPLDLEWKCGLQRYYGSKVIKNRSEIPPTDRQEQQQQFYMGTDKLSKAFGLAVSEHKVRRNMTQTLGSAPKELVKPHAKVTNRPISMEDASAMPASEHAVPLLSMLYQSLTDRPELHPSSKYPKFDHSLYPTYLKKN
ncbi:hypothetical protein F5Y16DRAFT_415821 [Xylariaceae sp. FL0255]|nr:hypothetical protein F5Y16DRAFT_415821 [Xylariaceae sp. FL0255]